MDDFSGGDLVTSHAKIEKKKDLEVGLVVRIE